MRKFALLSIFFVVPSFCTVSHYMAQQMPIVLKNNLNVAQKSYFTGCMEVLEFLQTDVPKSFNAKVCHEKSIKYQTELANALDATN